MGDTSASRASIGLTATNTATMVTNVSIVWKSPNAVAIISTGRLMESFCARRSRSYEAASS